MRRLLALVLLGLCLTLPARAQDAPATEALGAARELTALISGDANQQMSAAIIGQMWPNIETQLAGKVDAATLAELRTEVERMVVSLTGEVMKNAPAIYARNFSAQELRDILAFYKTPTGAKALRVMPKVMADVGATLAPHMPAFQRDMGGRLDAIMQKHGYKN
ncbi:MAG TPA: DUF2059 domain-containing protein [Pseudolabrys sp.]